MTDRTDDLLIVRLSDRAKERRRDRSMHAPLGANLGLVFAAAFGVLIFAKWNEINIGTGQAQEATPLLAIAIAGVVCIVLFAALGRALKLRRRFSASRSTRHYESFPVDNDAAGSDDVELDR